LQEGSLAPHSLRDCTTSESVAFDLILLQCRRDSAVDWRRRFDPALTLLAHVDIRMAIERGSPAIDSRAMLTLEGRLANLPAFGTWTASGLVAAGLTLASLIHVVSHGSSS
jgi:hypothetical protein